MKTNHFRSIQNEVGGLYQKRDGVAVLWLSCRRNTLFSALVIITTQSNFLEPRISKPPDNSEAKFDSFLSIVH